MSARLPRLFFNYSVVISAPSRGLTQTVTQTRKRPGRMGWTQWIAHRAESTQKRRKALRHNAFRRSSYLHTQEFTGSSPAVSTTKNLGITMVPRFFLCLFLEEKSLSACGILGYFRVISGLLVAKVLQIFSALYPLCHKGLRLFRQSRLLQTF